MLFMLGKCTEFIRETKECFTCLYRTDENPLGAVTHYEAYVSVFAVNTSD